MSSQGAIVALTGITILALAGCSKAHLISGRYSPCGGVGASALEERLRKYDLESFDKARYWITKIKDNCEHDGALEQFNFELAVHQRNLEENKYAKEHPLP